MSQKPEWKLIHNPFNSGNHILKCEDFYISYVCSTRGAVSFFDGDGSGEETALYKDGKFYILNGDHRDGYEKVAPDFSACLKYFKAHEHEASSWSEHKERRA